MAENTSDHLTYVLHIEAKYLDFLAQIRHWHNLKVAPEKEFLWLKDFTKEQINSLEVNTIPFKTLYYLKQASLFPLGSNLPSMKISSNLTWKPIASFLKVTLPKFNNNYFGLNEKVSIELVPSDLEQEPFALFTSIALLKNYIETAPNIRLKPLSWVIVEQDQALIIGKPLLPIRGKTFWQHNNMLLPTGFNFKFKLLADTISESFTDNTAWLIWNKDNTYYTIKKDDFEKLSLSSFRLSTHFMKK